MATVELLPTGRRCAACVGIKTRRLLALRQGDLRAASALRIAMGRHQRAVHA
ncbi:hypothetical protein ACFQ2B_37835 [Streptomyces stramineus]|uniref:hypothetical protein n=1 Tax=Streptomyces TaxID=1883 RepID=UPI0031DCB06F